MISHTADGWLTIDIVLQYVRLQAIFDLLERLLRLQPLRPPPSGFVFSLSGGSLEIRAFLEWSRSATSLWRQGKPLRLFLVTSPSAKRAHQESPCGLGPLLIYKLPLLCGVSVEPAGKKPRSNVSQDQTYRLE